MRHGLGTASTRRSPRGGRAIVAALVVMVVFTAGAMAFWWDVAWVPAVLAAVLFIVVLILAELDRRVQHERQVEAESEEQRERIVATRTWAVGTKTTLVIVGGLLAISIVVASIFFQWKAVGIGALLLFAWMILIGMPVWLATVKDEKEIEREQLTGEPTPTSHGDRHTEPPPRGSTR